MRERRRRTQSGTPGSDEHIALLQVERKDIKGAMVGAEKAARSREGVDLLPGHSGPACRIFLRLHLPTWELAVKHADAMRAKCVSDRRDEGI